MNVALVIADIFCRGRVFFGPAQMSSMLKRDGHTVSLIDFNYEPLERSYLADKAAKAPADLIGISVLSTHQSNLSLEIAEMLKEIYGAPIIAGGPAVTAEPEFFIKDKNIDMVCIGEGEGALAELVRRMEDGEEFHDTRNLWVKWKGQIIKNPVRPLVQDLDALPLMDRDIFFDNPAFRKEDIAYIAVMAGRGCPYNCTYCINPLLKKLYGAKGLIRFRSPSGVVAEILEIERKYSPISFIYFEDDTLTLNKEWIRQFSSEVQKNKVNLPLSVNVRLDTIDRETLELLSKAGVKEVRFGVETGDEEISRNVLNRRIGYDKIRANSKLLKQYGFFSKTYNMIGIPGETKHSIFKTILLNIDINPDIDYYSFFQPYPGTELGEFCRKMHYFDKDLRILSSYSEGATVSTEKLHRFEVNKLSAMAFAISNIRRFTPLQPVMQLGGTKLRLLLLNLIYTLFYKTDFSYHATLRFLKYLGRIRRQYISRGSTYLSILEREK